MLFRLKVEEATKLKDFGSHWDTRKIRRAREFGWFRQNEARLIEDARRKARLGLATARPVFLPRKIDRVAEEALLERARALLKSLPPRKRS